MYTMPNAKSWAEASSIANAEPMLGECSFCGEEVEIFSHTDCPAVGSVIPASDGFPAVALRNVRMVDGNTGEVIR